MSMNILISKTVIADSLETAFYLKTYVEIIGEVASEDFSISDEFTKKYNGYYRVRQKSEAWYDRYYRLLAGQRRSPRPFVHLLREMHKVGNSVEVSFVSKLMATVDPNLPVWDKYVLRNFHMDGERRAAQYKDADTRILLAEDIYQRISDCYSDFLGTEDGEQCIAAFDEALPEYKEKLTPVKKIDFLLWSKRGFV